MTEVKKHTYKDIEDFEKRLLIERCTQIERLIRFPKLRIISKTVTIDVGFGSWILNLKNVLEKEDKKKVGFIIPLDLKMQYGKLDGELFSAERKQILGTDSIDIVDYKKKTDRREEGIEVNGRDWFDFNEKMNQGNEIRIWVRPDVESYCGLYFLMDYLADKPNKVSIIFLKEDVLDFMPTKEALTEGLKNAEIATDSDKAKYAKEWARLKKENGSVRVLLESGVVSRDETEYDYLIDSHLGKEVVRWDETKHRFAENSYDKCIWLSYRLHELMDAGYISIVEEKSIGGEVIFIIKKQKEFINKEDSKSKLKEQYAMLLKYNRVDSFSETLLKMISDSGLAESEVYKRAGVDRRLFSKIRNDANYVPSKKTAILFAIALHLTSQQTDKLLESAGYALSSSSDFDLIIKKSIEQGNYDLYQINEVLDMFGLDTL